LVYTQIFAMPLAVTGRRRCRQATSVNKLLDERVVSVKMSPTLLDLAPYKHNVGLINQALSAAADVEYHAGTNIPRSGGPV
jgi:hypothetical protein